MKTNPNWVKRLCTTGLAASVLVAALSAPVLADPPGGRYGDRDGDRREWGGRDDRGDRDSKRGREERSDRDERSRPRGGDEQRDRNVQREQNRDRWSYTEQRSREGYDPKPWDHLYPPGYRSGDRHYERDYHYDRDNHRSPPRIIYRGKPRAIPHDRVRWYRDVVIVRPFGHWYPGYAHYRRDDDAYKWLAFTAITLGLLDYLNEVQQREHEAAQISATTAPIGERIYWEDGGARGYVVATREGTTSGGRYCREFQHQVSIGGRSEQAYGTACRNPDGSWEVVSSGSD
ncbi:MAG: hypothetical protein R3F42_08525 [Pseudomonadota bacterium]